MKILATVDGSPQSRAILPALQKLASETGASVRLLTVAEPESATRQNPLRVAHVAAGSGGPSIGVPSLATTLEPVGATWAETQEQALDRLGVDGREFLDDMAKPLIEAGIDVQLQVLIDTDPARAIIAAAREQDVDVIAMATHGRSGLREVIQGSVAAAVVRSGVKPVLLTRPAA
jgi:nucleotide-binding universal stress UspA family protein